MDRYVFFTAERLSPHGLREAGDRMEQLGATLVAALAGSLLVEVDDDDVASVASRMPGWDYTRERPQIVLPEQ
ncbi:MAG: hypothetical protein HY020_07090 [Burkholderiales bacterium]|nr:hypothetical protein [Burkholderiales bacterium]